MHQSGPGYQLRGAPGGIAIAEITRSLFSSPLPVCEKAVEYGTYADATD